jgi:hypothetical protein
MGKCKQLSIEESSAIQAQLNLSMVTKILKTIFAIIDP